MARAHPRPRRRAARPVRRAARRSVSPTPPTRGPRPRGPRLRGPRGEGPCGRARSPPPGSRRTRSSRAVSAGCRRTCQGLCWRGRHSTRHRVYVRSGEGEGEAVAGALATCGGQPPRGWGWVTGLARGRGRRRAWEDCATDWARRTGPNPPPSPQPTEPTSLFPTDAGSATPTATPTPFPLRTVPSLRCPHYGTLTSVPSLRCPHFGALTSQAVPRVALRG
jgi:hypothetical protein